MQTATSDRGAARLWTRSLLVGLTLGALGDLRGGVLHAQTGASRPSSAAEFPFYQPVQPPRPFQVMVHRGMAKQAPENSGPAIMMCIADELEWVEIDVRLSKDGIHVLAHDDQLDVKTDGRGRVSDSTVEHLHTLDAGSWFARRYANNRLLTLQQALQIAKGRVNLYLDCKQVDAEKLVADVRAAGMERQVVVYGNMDLIDRVRTLSGAQVAVMTKWHPAFGFDDWIGRVRPAAVEVDADEVAPEVCQRFHRNGIKVQAKTIGTKWDCPKVWTQVMTAGVDWIQTDFPNEVLLQSLRLRQIPWPVKISHHRGALRYPPENTIPAIEQAMTLGADYIELDVRTSQDGRFFLLHDSSLDRTTDARGPLRALTGDQLSKLDAGAWFGRPFAGARIPTLDEALVTMDGGKGRTFTWMPRTSLPDPCLRCSRREK